MALTTEDKELLEWARAELAQLHSLLQPHPWEHMAEIAIAKLIDTLEQLHPTRPPENVVSRTVRECRASLARDILTKMRSDGYAYVPAEEPVSA